MQQLRTLVPEWMRKRNAAEVVIVRCNLLPLGFTVSASLLLICFSCIAWLMAGSDHNARTVVSFFLSVVWIPLIVGASMKLKLRMTASGLAAPSRLHQGYMFGRVRRPWTDLHSVRLRRFVSSEALLQRLGKTRTILDRPTPLQRALRLFAQGWLNQGFIVLDFQSGGSIPFPLAGFSGQALDDLFAALSRWGDPLCLNPDVIALQRDVLSSAPVQLGSSYTRMWEESLKRSFEATNFVPLSAGDQLMNGQYQILMLLACGGQSSVYLATDKNGQRVVLKELAPATIDPVAHQKLHELFQREGLILSKLDDPNIVKIFDHFVEKERNYLVLEFVAGLTLRQLVQMQGALSEKEVIEVGKRIANILIYLHTHDPPVLHRDLSPDNFVIREVDREVMLIDFGAANEYVSKVTGTMIGKQCYIPPEQFRGQAIPASDLYSVGATMFYLLTGQDPVPISTSHPRASNGAISEACDRLVAQLTAIDESERPHSAADFLTSLKEMEQLPYPAVEKNRP